ncbi:hypothetical protein GX50_04472 [[Emmonsia] crescens]|uniref:Uncharacterized protein n=1 Tax=[Emmonsia] crescens TaxID=73230 RepID=A0A2B7ZIV8_9EURO|nr:hypothetical protein GX50_04472 [Emmonsia crescens]
MAAALYIPEICKSLLKDNLSAFWRIECEVADIRRTHYNWCRELNLLSTTASANRLETIELLVGAGALVTDPPQQVKLNLLDSSFLLVTVFLGLSATTKLMALGAQPGSASPDSFSRCMAVWGSSWKAGVSKETRVVMESSLQGFVGHLFSTSIYPTEIGRKIATIAWSAASKFSFSLAGSDLAGQDLTCVEEALRAKAVTAVFDDDAEALRNWLVNGILDISEPFHVAVMANSASAGQILLDSNPDLDALDSDGGRPIHICDNHESNIMLDLLLQKGASHISTDSSGNNIWHKSACLWSSGTPPLQRLLELDHDQTIEALLMRTPGRTSLLSTLAQPNIPNIVTKVLLILDHCAGNLKFWKAHGPVSAAAAEFGSEVIIERLIQAGVELDPVGNDNLTPLHRLGSYATCTCAQLLKHLYPDAHQLRFQDQTPLEIYIEKYLKLGEKPNEDVLAVLATPEALSSQNTSGETVWSFCCKELPTKLLSWNAHVRLYSHFENIILAIIRLGAMISHEETMGQSEILPLFSALGLECAQNELYTTDISYETLSTIILGSKFWDDARKSSAAVAFLIEAIRDGYLEAVKLILDHGVSVHQHVKQISPIEFAIQNFTGGHKKVESDKADSKEILLALLSYATLEELKNYNPHGRGFGLLHRVVEPQHGGKADTYWLLKELIGLIGRGADVNGEARFMAGYTPLVHYLSRGFFETAEMLLDFGANPSANSAFDPVRASLTLGGVSFLKRLLKYSKETGTPLHWNRTIATYTLELEGSSTDILGATCLHYIAWQGLSEILAFYTDGGLLEDINIITADG